MGHSDSPSFDIAGGYNRAAEWRPRKRTKGDGPHHVGGGDDSVSLDTHPARVLRSEVYVISCFLMLIYGNPEDMSKKNIHHAVIISSKPPYFLVRVVKAANISKSERKEGTA